MPNIPYLERIGCNLELYQDVVEDTSFGPYRARLCKQYLVISSPGPGIVYYSHHYKSRLGIKLAPYQPEIAWKEQMDDIQLRSHTMTTSKAEALVAKYPNRSIAWRYGALCYFHCKDLHEAKLFIRRGISTIDSREHQEKLLLWKALIMFEARNGSKEDLLAVFEEALRHNNKRKLCSETLGCLNEVNETEAFEIIKERILHKFKKEKDMYILLGEYQLKMGEKVKDLLERGLKYVPPKEHPDLLRKFEILVHKYGASTSTIGKV